VPIRDSSDFPELVFGVAGPIGGDIDSICDSLSNALRVVRYQSEIIHLTKEMIKYEPSANASALAQVALRAIAIRRAMLPGGKLQVPVPSTAYIVRQLKRPDEISLLRQYTAKILCLFQRMALQSSV
jgi:hypothetical protein